MAYGDYYDPSTKTVIDGDTILAADINAINLAVDAAFEEVAEDLDGLAADLNLGGLGPLQDITPSADTLAYYTAADEAALTTITSQARTLLGDATASAQKATIGLANVPNVDCTNASNINSGTLAESRVSTAIARVASPTFTGTVGGISKSMVGLGNVDNTSDASKPISTATQNALNLKANLNSPTFTGTPVLPNATYAISISGNASTATTASDLSAGVALANIGADGLSYSYIQNVTTGKRVLGAETSSTNPSEYSTSQILDWIGSPAQGQLLFRGASGWSLLAPGTSGHVLKTQGAGADLTWGSSFTIASSAEAIAGSNNTNVLTPLRLRDGLNASGSAPVYACRAWVVFNGTGTVAILASGNVSSITDNDTGDYTINFTTAMPDANYCVTQSAQRMGSTGSTHDLCISSTSAPSTTALRVEAHNQNGTLQDSTLCSVAIFR